jgi:uncharacterized membrane protein YhaH (DUF805 family)
MGLCDLGKIMNWYLEVLKKYAVFDGRARRKEYWFFVLFNLIVALVLAFLDGMIGTFDAETGYGVLSGVYMLAVIIPGIAVTIRRLHDSDRSGWWWLICFIPLIGAIVLIVFMIIDGTAGQNQYGPDPKAIAL